MKGLVALTSRGSSVCTVSDFRLDDRGSILGREKEFFSSCPCVETSSEAHPAYLMGTGGKAWPGRDADHLPPTNADVKNE
jgi:hypothetical protein